MAISKLSGSPDLLSLHAANPARYPYLLQTQGAEGWDILFAFPESIRLYGLHEPGIIADLSAAFPHIDLPADPQSRLPFTGGWFVYLGYETLHFWEPTVARRHAGTTFPMAAFSRVPVAIQVDRASGEAFLFAEDARADLIDVMRRDIKDSASWSPAPIEVFDVREEDGERFLDGVRAIKRYIREGDVFQVNLSRRWEGFLGKELRAADLFASLRRNNPAPFSGLADFGTASIVSSSPERLVRVRGNLVETRPIAGTYPRSADPDEDRILKHNLRHNPKEQAEHIMLVDLERNDLGRIAEPGSVRVDELMAVETYAHVHHIESNVQATLRQDVRPVDVLRSLFPGGTITGCPKVRTMQIISELEHTPRSAYTGSMGYINRDGSMDLNILIRTVMLEGDRFAFSAGAGIVADSVPERELAETRAKAKGLLRALSVLPSDNPLAIATE